MDPSESALTEARRRLCFALDYDDLDTALSVAREVAPFVGVFKVGLELFVRCGPAAIEALTPLGCSIFLDLKLHDIPATVAGAVRSASAWGIDYLTLHAGGGREMLQAAASAAESGARGGREITLLGVTVLTSMDAAELAGVGVADEPGPQAQRLARLALGAGLGGLVCSPEEVARLRFEHGPAAVLVTPGIRPAGADLGDQKRTGTPADAIQAGASLLVVGRPIRNATDPGAAALAIRAQIASALAPVGG